MKFHRTYLLSLFVLLMACEPTTKKESKSQKRPENGEMKQYRADGSVKTLITYKNGKKNGVSKNFYENGKVRQQVEYVDNIKHGTAITYYESGKKFQVTPYVDGKITGVREKYRMNGALTTEAPYKEDKPCSGLKEYLKDGALKKKYPKIMVREIDNTLKNNEYIVELYMSDHSDDVMFYMGKLDNGGCIASDAMKLVPQKPGLMQLKYNLPPGAFMMEEMNIIALVKTKLGNIYITTKKFNLAAENRG
ncbi:toxin-antitoxin system YwqK family antitoxin [Fulvivirga ligni]|uniref:toxin-antitoxin system YwqK family antitoxin n=1 Tax=Fulvivirga ligni TaxID=2904246 RepID=UPI001F424BB8|nr:toxin-antitoxin system YwqK family antitoxin [Fulvivirga ligni]UII22000.1 toxin-antitoxin system YwqK family antitoxin [Fulvivirga ligni]